MLRISMKRKFSFGPKFVIGSNQTIRTIATNQLSGVLPLNLDKHCEKKLLQLFWELSWFL
jgi:hypothetical protein